MLIGTEEVEEVVVVEEESGWAGDGVRCLFFFFFFCRSIKNAVRGLNESRLMLTARGFNRLVMKCFCVPLEEAEWRGWRCQRRVRHTRRNICLSCPSTYDYP